jgi:hypothetical protein
LPKRVLVGDVGLALPLGRWRFESAKGTPEIEWPGQPLKTKGKILDHILYPTFYATLEDGKAKTSKSLVELTNWAKEAKTGLLVVRRFEADGSIRIQPTFVYEFTNGRPVRVW